ncbi:GCN5-related N-acetyltransferase [Denitrovibrio acetiphilus DSM 12809]|uniref:GCN5-related N-acetyltransferase n=1 Tax=Denitrovibrio acetiphilus (strain DSM 12809 / NBRC 114555 / N2460) TaxID=522772 RepID=D4H600_DENA2|nr:putative beta-lysine N-acetyltransferase [Denitrovibrio acetiphilus]ADD67646.1 GCN5-related N-acetyltransferase [Denitrovibrio acetiphilus DSM 12809]
MDEIITVGNSQIQHGKHNDRAYILSFSEEDGNATVDIVELLARKQGYSKIIAKVPKTRVALFEKKNYVTEGQLENSMYEQYFFVAKYLSEKRRDVQNMDEIKDVISTALSCDSKETSGNFEIRSLNENDIDAQIAIYKTVFKSYPFPIYYRDFIMEMMDSHVTYYGVFENGEMIATSSAEVDNKSGLAEMTDFATLPEHRGKGFAVSLLQQMEKDLEQRGIRSFFTIARSVSYGMNKTFARCGYSYSGTLYNNTNINGDIESMNIWYKVI